MSLEGGGVQGVLRGRGGAASVLEVNNVQFLKIIDKTYCLYIFLLSFIYDIK